MAICSKCVEEALREPCKFGSLCTNGSACSYNHKKQLCWHFSQGKCTFGVRCLKSHQLPVCTHKPTAATVAAVPVVPTEGAAASGDGAVANTTMFCLSSDVPEFTPVSKYQR